MLQQTLLSVKDLSQAYLHKRILKKINLDIHQGELVTMMGPNGAGKTTLLRVLCGLLKPLSGSVHRAEICRQINLFVSQESLYDELTLRENLDFYSKLYGTVPELGKKMREAFNLTNFLDHPYQYLSQGQKVRGALCRTFLMDASIYLLDEPFNGLDTESASKLVALLEQFKKNKKTIILTTHYQNYVQKITDRWLWMSDGHLHEKEP